MSRLLAIASLILTFALLLVACQAQPATNNQAPTVIPFPTMTIGQQLHGALTTAVPNAQQAQLSNPATAIALANRPTATPDYARCPAPNADAEMPQQAPSNSGGIRDAIVRFMSNGGAPETLDHILRNTWQIMGDNGIVRADLDLTHDGVPDLLVTYTSQNEGGTLLIMGCSDARYTVHYDSTLQSEIPQIVHIGDMTHDAQPEILFASRICDDTCSYRVQLVTWRAELGRFVNLLEQTVNSENLPEVNDVDNDQIQEVVIRLTNRGNAETGPLRTGIHIYDWNGAAYIQSVTQLDPPRYRIQVIHEADRQLNRLNANEALQMYQFAIANNALEVWRNDETPILPSYIQYRMLLAEAYLADNDRILATYQAILQNYPDPESVPVYIDLSHAFWNALQVTNNLRSACLNVHEIIAQRPESLEFMNRYGDRSPVYTAETLCPF